MTESGDLNAYLREAASWDSDRAAQARRQSRIAYAVAALFALCAIASALALAGLMPLKRVEPFLIRVNAATGVIDTVPLYTGQAALPETVTRYLLTHYLSTCERFVYELAEQDYEECGTFNGAKRNQEWAASWAIGNPDSPLNRYRDGTAVHVDVQSVSFFERSTGVSDLAQIRYTTHIQPGGQGGEQDAHWIASVQFTYARPSSDAATRRWNPLGFKILSFRREAEVAVPSSTVSLAGNAARQIPP